MVIETDILAIDYHIIPFLRSGILLVCVLLELFILFLPIMFENFSESSYSNDSEYVQDTNHSNGYSKTNNLTRNKSSHNESHLAAIPSSSSYRVKIYSYKDINSFKEDQLKSTSYGDNIGMKYRNNSYIPEDY